MSTPPNLHPMFEDWFYRHGGGVMFQRPDDVWRLACWHVWERRYW
jgi:hypothetical protein